MLLAILLMMALMIIGVAVELPRLVQQMKRDREEEMVHRGTEYARAIEKFYKKFGRYPTVWNSSTIPTRFVFSAGATRTRFPKTASGSCCIMPISKRW